MTTIGMDLTAAAGNLTTGILSTVGAPATAAPSRPGAGGILALIQRDHDAAAVVDVPVMRHSRSE
ncbi:hypothetical protein [Actinomadura rudentiformis]|uniref:hypothetical protein n=1 Tax=Actinomadura rudentiformis TaxID=359158 RepID=UPI001CEF9166|nr:hypothetical protein [Actinomadura rudentiformis]